MTTITRTIKIEHEKFGILLNETFIITFIYIKYIKLNPVSQTFIPHN